MMLLLTLLQMFLLIRCSWQSNEEFCQRMIRRDIKGEENIPITGFLDKNYSIRFQCAFEDKVEADDMDSIKLTPRASEFKKKRNGISTSELLNATIPFGWVNMNITVSKNEINISPYIGSITFEYPLRELIIASDNITLCPQETPSWKIVKDLGATVPLYNLSNCSISIKSEKDYSPIINLLGFKFEFAYNSGIILGSSGSKLPGNSYRFILENEKDTLRLMYQESECDTTSVLATLRHKDAVTNLTANTLDEDYTLVLQPVVAKAMCEQNTEAPAERKMSDYKTMIIGIVLAILIVLFCGIIVLLKLKMRKKKKAYTKLDKEKNELLEKKNKIDGLLSEPKTMEDVRNELLWDAASSGDILTVTAAIKGGADLNYQYSLSVRTPLYAACQGGHLPVVQKLLVAGANKDIADNSGTTPLDIAIKEGHNNIVELLKAGDNS